MKISIVIICLTVVVYSCGNGENKGEPTTTASASSDAPASASANATNTENEKGLELVVQSNCTTCHKIEEKLTGPAYRDVANKYTADEQTITMLANKVIKGGKGVWGPIPMTPHPELSIDDAKQMVKYVLSLKNK